MFRLFRKKPSARLIEETEPLCASNGEGDIERPPVSFIRGKFNLPSERFLLEEIRACIGFLNEAQQTLPERVNHRRHLYHACTYFSIFLLLVGGAEIGLALFVMFSVMEMLQDNFFARYQNKLTDLWSQIQAEKAVIAEERSEVDELHENISNKNDLIYKAIDEYAGKMRHLHEDFREECLSWKDDEGNTHELKDYFPDLHLFEICDVQKFLEENHLTHPIQHCMEILDKASDACHGPWARIREYVHDIDVMSNRIDTVMSEITDHESIQSHLENAISEINSHQPGPEEPYSMTTVIVIGLAVLAIFALIGHRWLKEHKQQKQDIDSFDQFDRGMRDPAKAMRVINLLNRLGIGSHQTMAQLITTLRVEEAKALSRKKTNLAFLAGELKTNKEASNHKLLRKDKGKDVTREFYRLAGLIPSTTKARK